MQYLKNFLFIRTTSQGEKSEKGDLHNDQFVCLCLLINFILFFLLWLYVLFIAMPASTGLRYTRVV